MSQTKRIALYLFILIAFLVIQKNDYNDMLAEFDKYCQNVKDGVHPDYKKQYDRCEV